MQRFQFRLQPVLEWRRLQLEMEEAKLEQMFANLRNIEARAAALESERVEAQRSVLASNRFEAAELAALESHRRRLVRERERVLRECGHQERLIAGQRGRVLEAERAVRLLERIRDRRITEWRSAAAREEEAFATESFLSRWGRT